MKVVIQYVKQASVTVADRPITAITRGYLLLVGIHRSDTPATTVDMAKKILNVRLIPDDSGKINRSILDISGEILVIPQFTLITDIHKGHRPSFIKAAPPKVAHVLFRHFNHALTKSLLPVKTGVFGAHMEVTLTNSGPITLILKE